MIFVCFLWRGHGFWKRTAKYDEGHVSVLASMLRRHGGHDLLCVQDGSFDIPRSVTMPGMVAAMPDYLPKLWSWSPAFHSVVGRRFAVIDLDVVVTGDLAPLLAGPEPVRIWDQAVGEPYNSSLFALEPGFGNEVWTACIPTAVAEAKAKAWRWTGDQSWVAHVLGPEMPTFGERHGVIQYRPKMHRAAMPAGTLAAFMCGPYEPRTEAQESEWVMQAWD